MKPSIARKKTRVGSELWKWMYESTERTSRADTAIAQ